MEGRHAGINIVKPRLVQLDEMLVMGVEVRTSNSREMNPATAEIPKLWNHFIEEQLWLDIPDPINPQIRYAVYTDYISNHLGEYAAIVATEVSSIDNPPESMVGVTIPAGRYLIFTATSTSRAVVVQTWQHIWDYFALGCRYQRAFTTDFERYDPEQVRIYIAIK